jgi:outer membrane immunogenic protein
MGRVALGVFMRKLRLWGMALLAFALASPALAADLPAEPSYKAAPLIVPTYDWTGFYIGVNGGYSWGKSANTFTITGFPAFTGSTHLNGDVFGGQAGYNWQVNNSWVVGIEADVQGANQKGTDTPPPIVATNCVGGIFCTTTSNGVSMDQTLNWFATARARVGFVPWDHLMLYVTGGGAFGEVAATATANAMTTISFFGTTTAISSANFANRRAGWTAGGGAEWVISGPWTAKLEYLFVDLGSYSNTVPVNPLVPSTAINSHVTDNIVRVGINYRFGGPVVARY